LFIEVNGSFLFFIIKSFAFATDAPFHLGEKEPKSPCPIEEIGEWQISIRARTAGHEDDPGSSLMPSFPIRLPTIFLNGQG